MKRPLVFLQGWGLSERVWEEFIQEQFSGYEAVSYNIFNYFQPGLDTEAQLENISDKLAKKINKNSFIVAWSLGGMIATRLSKKLVENQHSLFLLCFNPCFVKMENYEYGVEETLVEQMINDLEINHRATLKRFYCQITHNSTNQKQTLKTLKQNNYIEDIEKQALLAGLRLLKEMDLRKELEEVNISTTLAYSENDSLIDPKIYMDKPFKNENIKYRLIKQADHIPFLSASEETAKILKQELERPVYGQSYQ